MEMLLTEINTYMKTFDGLDAFLKHHQNLAKEYKSKISARLNLDRCGDSKKVIQISGYLDIDSEVYKVGKKYHRKAVYKNGDVTITFHQKII